MSLVHVHARKGRNVHQRAVFAARELPVSTAGYSLPRHRTRLRGMPLAHWPSTGQPGVERPPPEVAQWPFPRLVGGASASVALSHCVSRSKYHEVTNKCCEFLCLDGDMTSTGLRFFNKTILAKGQEKSFTGLSSTSLGKPPGHSASAKPLLGLRLIASTVVSFLVLALLLFLIHRLRQRRLLLVIRRLQTRRLHAPAAHPSHASPPRFGYLGSRSAASAGLSPPFGFGPMEPPPPYSFWKAPELVAPGEAPPSYEESLDWRGQGMTPSRPLGHSPTHLPLPPHNRTTPHYPGRVVTLASLATRPPNTPTWASSDGHTHSKRGEGSPVPGQSEPAVLATARKTVSATGRPRHSHRRPSHLTYPARQTGECHSHSTPLTSALCADSLQLYPESPSEHVTVLTGPPLSTPTVTPHTRSATQGGDTEATQLYRASPVTCRVRVVSHLVRPLSCPTEQPASDPLHSAPCPANSPRCVVPPSVTAPEWHSVVSSPSLCSLSSSGSSHSSQVTVVPSVRRPESVSRL